MEGPSITVRDVQKFWLLGQDLSLKARRTAGSLKNRAIGECLGQHCQERRVPLPDSQKQIQEKLAK